MNLVRKFERIEYAFRNLKSVEEMRPLFEDLMRDIIAVSFEKKLSFRCFVHDGELTISNRRLITILKSLSLYHIGATEYDAKFLDEDNRSVLEMFFLIRQGKRPSLLTKLWSIYYDIVINWSSIPLIESGDSLWNTFVETLDYIKFYYDDEELEEMFVEIICQLEWEMKR